MAHEIVLSPKRRLPGYYHQADPDLEAEEDVQTGQKTIDHVRQGLRRFGASCGSKALDSSITKPESPRLRRHQEAKAAIQQGSSRPFKARFGRLSDRDPHE